MSIANPSVSRATPADPSPSPYRIEYSAKAPDHAAEWLLTDGRGGFAMGTASGVPTRRYHALFIAATQPPVGRLAMLNATVDQLVIHADTPHALPWELSSFQFVGGQRIHPDGASRIVRFEKSTHITWTYELPMARITRSLTLVRGETQPDRTIPDSSALLRYVVERTAAEQPAAPLRLNIRPLVSLRDFHGLIRRDWADRFHVTTADRRSVRVDRDGIALHLTASDGAFNNDPHWWFNFQYAEDAARGQDCVEDLFSPGAFSLDLAPDQTRAEIVLRASCMEQSPPTPNEVTREQDSRRRQLAALAGVARSNAPKADAESADWIGALAAASDDFVVARRPAHAGEPAGVSVIAGYPWFSDWGRDTFISLPGLMLATGRWAEARATLLAFAAHCKRGLIPNVFDDRTGEAEYNTIDASLWFIQAACAYVESTGDRAVWRERLAPVCDDIIAHFRRGTDFNIAMDPFDKLITAGTSATQLTWMDARRDGVVFTPRHGKAVEINALWISGLRRVSALLAPDDASQAANLNDLADAAAKSFRAKFWNESKRCLFDVLTPSDSERGEATWNPDAAIRPNQILAVSLPHGPLTPEQQLAVVTCVRTHLLTPRGVRTLHPADSRYRGRYEGSLFQRDGAYHQGTAWPWLLGPLAEATLRAGGFSDDARRAAVDTLRPMLNTLEPGRFAVSSEGTCPGHIAEIYDGDAPQHPQGCPAQAWSIAEALRVLCMIHAPASGR